MRVVVLGASVASEWPLFAVHHIETMIGSTATARELLARDARAVAAEGVIDCHVMLNTGMNRDGLATFDSSTETHGRRAPADAHTRTPISAALFASPERAPVKPPKPPEPVTAAAALSAAAAAAEGMVLLGCCV